MIIGVTHLRCFRGAVAMVSGGFDPIHDGHVEHFRQAASLGLPVLCNVSPDQIVGEKHVPLLAQAQRARVIDALRYIDLTYPAPGETVDVLHELRPRFFVKGSDWRDRLPSEEIDACERYGIEVVYLDTVVNSSSEILKKFQATHVSSFE